MINLDWWLQMNIKVVCSLIFETLISHCLCGFYYSNKLFVEHFLCEHENYCVSSERGLYGALTIANASMGSRNNETGVTHLIELIQFETNYFETSLVSIVSVTFHLSA